MNVKTIVAGGMILAAGMMWLISLPTKTDAG
jgi:hypothetical protein